jgi:hypothetical protein
MPQHRAVERWSIRPVSAKVWLYSHPLNEEVVLLPDDFAIQELLGFNADDEQELLTFVQKWGPFTSFGKSMFQGWPNDVWSQEMASMWDQIRDSAEEQGLGRREYLVPTDAVKWIARSTQATAAFTLRWLEGRQSAELMDVWPQYGFNTAEQLSDALRWWQERLNAALEIFQMHVKLSGDVFDWSRVHVPRPSLLNACALQLTEYVQGEGEIQRCANERCGKPFTRQRSGRRRYEGTQHSAGLKYCSHLCAKAQSERERRRRRREERK